MDCVTITAAFTGTPVSGSVLLTVTFSDGSTGTITHWSWGFGDGSTLLTIGGGSSTAVSPTHVYTQGGVYTAR